MVSASAKTRLVEKMLRAFADRTRLRIMHLLLDGEMCVGDLVTIMRLAQPSASRHLAYLRKAGLVSARKAGYWSFYSLTPARDSFHERLLDCLRCAREGVPEIERDIARAKKVKNAGGCCPGDSTCGNPM